MRASGNSQPSEPPSAPDNGSDEVRTTRRNSRRDSPSHLETSPRCNEKKMGACQTLPAPTPPSRHKGQTEKRGRDHQTLPLQPEFPRETRTALFAESSGADRKPCGESFTHGRRKIDSSTRVGSVASLGNQDGVDYYRNDSPGDDC